MSERDAFKKLLEDFNTIEQTITKQEIEVEVESPVKVRLLAELKARQLTDPKTEVLVVKNNKVITIDKKDLPRYVDNGWALAEAHGGKHTTTGRSMTKGEEGEKERLVKGMKKNKSDFKKRYGKDADAVMYATATKNAMEDDLEELDTKGLQRFPANIMKGKKKEKGDTDRDKAYFKMQQKRKEKQTAESEIGVRREDLAGMLVNRFNQFFRKATPEEIKAMAQLLDYKTRDEDKNFVKIEKEDIEEAMFEAEEKSPQEKLAIMDKIEKIKKQSKDLAGPKDAELIKKNKNLLAKLTKQLHSESFAENETNERTLKVTKILRNTVKLLDVLQKQGEAEKMKDFDILAQPIADAKQSLVVIFSNLERGSGISENDKECPDGQYYCNDEQKCKPIPQGHSVEKDGNLVKDEVDLKQQLIDFQANVNEFSKKLGVTPKMLFAGLMEKNPELESNPVAVKIAQYSKALAQSKSAE